MRNILLILALFAALAFSREASAQTVILKADTISISCASSDTFLVPIRVVDFENIGSFQFSLMWDTAKLDYAYTTPINPLFEGNDVDYAFNNTQLNLGKIAFLWTKTNGGSVPDSTIVFQLAFRRIGGSFASVMFVGAPVPIEVASTTGDILNAMTMSGGVKPIDDKVPIIACPDSVTVQGFGGTSVSGIAPDTITDNCAPVANVGWVSTGATVASQPNDPDASGSSFNIGTSTVTYTATDVGGNTATCSFTVTVELSLSSDTLTIIAGNVNSSCGQTLSIDITALNFDSLGSLQFSVGWDQALLQYSSVSNFNPALLLNLGDNFNTLQTANGLLAFLWTANASEGVTLPPGAVLFTLNLSVLTGGGSGSPITFGDSPISREAVSNASGTPEIISAFWINGSVNVADLVPPILECPGNVAVDLPTGSTNVLVNDLEPDALLDNCGGNINLTYNNTGTTPGSGSGNANGNYNPGVTTVTYTATDLADNISTCSFTVTVNAAGALTLLIDSVAVGCQGADSIAVNVFVDNWDDIFGLQFNVEWDETVLAYSSVGNFNPGLNLTPGDFGTAQTNNGTLLFFAGGSNSNWPQLADSSVLFTIYFDVLSPNGTSNINFTGFIEAITSTISTVPVLTVGGLYAGGGADNTPPTVTCPANITTTSPIDTCVAVVNIDLPTASDDCGIDTISRFPTDSVFSFGVAIVTYSVTDSAGNVATCSLTVTVADGAPPSVVCPANVTATAINDCSASVDVLFPQATDDCSGVDTITRVPDGNIFLAGPTVVVYTVTDSAGNTTTCSLTVSVLENNPPTFNNTCPTAVTSAASGFSCQGLADWVPPVPSDTCGQSNLTVTSNFTPDSMFNVGETLVIYTVTDFSGNTATCSFLVTIQDTASPIIVCPNNLTVAPDGSPNCGAVVSYDLPLAFDNCDQDVLILGDSTTQPNDTFPSGITTVVYQAIDDGSNLSTCIFTITVVDTVGPLLICPNDTIFAAAPDMCGAIATWAIPTANDACDGAVTPTSPSQPGSSFPVGTTSVVYTATDGLGNSSQCSFSVTVTETVPPIILGCPGDILITLPVGDCDTTVFWNLPTATDNCALDGLIASHIPNTSFPAGTTVVTYTATDLSGNSTTCSFSVVALDEIAPVFSTCPSDVTVDDAPPCGVPVDWPVPTATDNCTPTQNLQITSSHAPATVFVNNETNVVYYVQDASGNYDTCSFKVVIDRAIQPGFDSIPQSQTIDGCPQPAFWTEPVPVGFCDVDTLYSNFQPGDTFPSGTTIVSYTVVEGSTGLATTLTFTITVTETVPPSISCPNGPIVVNIGGGVISDPSEFLSFTDTVTGCNGARLDFEIPAATDDCGIASLLQTSGGLSGDVFAIGLDTLTFTALDSSGNSTVCSVVVEVQGLPDVNPVSSPQLGCLNLPVTITATSIPGATYQWQLNQQTLPDTDNVVSISQFASANEGTYTVVANVNGCPAPAGSILVELASEPDAVDDTNITVAPGDTVTFNVLENDILVPPSDFEITSVDTLTGLVNLGNGDFVFLALQTGGIVTFQYEVCSKSCPTLCNEALVTIAVRDNSVCTLPNIFTPNEDGVNDWLVIPCLDDPRAFPDNSLVVFNQWGDKVFESAPYSNDPAKAWHGTLNGNVGQDLPDAVYYYVFKPGLNEPVVKGFVEIFR